MFANASVLVGANMMSSEGIKEEMKFTIAKKEKAREYKLGEFQKKITKCLKDKNQECLKSHIADGIYFPHKLTDDELKKCIEGGGEKERAKYTPDGVMVLVPGDNKAKIRSLDSNGYVKCLFNFKKENQVILHQESNLYTVYDMMLDIFSSGILSAESSHDENYFRIVNTGYGYCYLFREKKDSNSSRWVITNCQFTESFSESMQLYGY